MTDDRRPVNFTLGAARRIKRVVDKVDGKAPPPGGRRPFAPARTPGIQLAKVTVAIPPGSRSSPSSAGRAVVIAPDGTEGEDEIAVHNALNLGGTSVAVDATAWIAWRAGYWWLIQADCPTS